MRNKVSLCAIPYGGLAYRWAGAVVLKFVKNLLYITSVIIFLYIFASVFNVFSMKKVVLSSKEAVLVRSLLVPLEREMYARNKLALYEDDVFFDPRLYELRNLLFFKFGASYDTLNG